MFVWLLWWSRVSQRWNFILGLWHIVQSEPEVAVRILQTTKPRHAWYCGLRDLLHVQWPTLPRAVELDLNASVSGCEQEFTVDAPWLDSLSSFVDGSMFRRNLRVGGSTLLLNDQTSYQISRRHNPWNRAFPLLYIVAGYVQSDHERWYE